MAEHRQQPDSQPRGRHAQPVNPAPQPGVRPRAEGQPTASSRRVVSGAAPQQPRGVPHPQQVGSPQRPTVNDQRRNPAPASSPQQAFRPIQPAGKSAGAHQGGSGKGTTRPNGQGSGKKRGPWRVVFWAALVVLVLSLVALGALMFSYWQGQNAYDSVAKQAFEAPADIEGTSLADLKVDWDNLRAINPDVIAWVYIPGTAVNYPIVHTTNDEKYLTYDFNGSQSWGATYGSIFLSAVNASDFSDANNIIYGHHLNNGSMFAAIAGFEDAAQYQAHRTVYVLTPQGNFKLKTFSLVHCAADDPLAQTVFADEAELTSYIQDKMNRSVVSSADVPAAADINRVFSFATCDNLPTDGRWVLFSSIVESTVPSVAASGVATGGAVDPSVAQAIDNSVKENAA